jgi:dTMP kinase
MKIICITGIDGSGKTTLSHLLVNEIRNRGIEAAYIYGRTFPVVSRLLMYLGRLLLLGKADPWKNYEDYSSAKKSKMKSPILRWGYSTAIWFDYFIQIWMKLTPKMIKGQVIVIDRYAYDTVISDLSVHLNLSGRQTLQIIKKAFHFLPVPAITFLMDLPEETAFSRKNDIPHIEYLRERRNLFQLLKDRPEVIELDGENPLSITLSAIIEIMKSREIL